MRLGDILIDLKLLTPEQFDVPYVDIDFSSVNRHVARLMPEDFARSNEAAAIEINQRVLTLAMIAPDDIETCC